MKYFLFSDPHGNLTALREALSNAGYDEDNLNHHLVGLGDYFDRGSENSEMANFIIEKYFQGRSTFLRGNHDQMLIDVLEKRDDGLFNCEHNGLGRTIEDLSKDKWHMLIQDQDYTINRINKNYPKLLEVLNQMKDTLEIKDFILTHGGYSNTENNPYDTSAWVVNNWAHTENFVRYFATSDIFNISKTYIFGHWHAFSLRHVFLEDTGKITHEPFIYRNFIGLDACTTITNKVNIYIIDEDLV